MDRNQKAVAAMLDQATAAVTLEKMRGRLANLTREDFPALACLLELLAAHPSVADCATLLGPVSAIQGLFGHLWDEVEEATEFS